MSIKVGDTIRILRQAKGLKVKTLAEAAKVSVPFVTLIEKGDREPSLAVLRRLAGALDVPFEAFVLISQPSNGTFETSDQAATKLMSSIRRVASAERNLRELMGEE